MRVFILVLALFSVRCSTTSPVGEQNQFRFDKSWARHTIQKEYLSYRLNHIMTPVLYKKLVIQGNEIDGLNAYDAKLGTKKWSVAIDGGVASAAHLAGDTLYFGGGDGFFYAVDLRTGTKKWTFPIRAEGIGAPTVEDGVVFFLAGNNMAYALKASSGEQIWFYNRTDPANLTIRGASEPTIVGSNILLGFSDGALVALDKTSGAVKWERQLGETTRFRDVDSKPILNGGKIYVSSYDGRLYCLNANDGREIWTHDDGGFLPVLVEGGVVYYPTSSRKFLALDADSGKVIWQNDLRNSVASTPVFYRGLLIYSEWSGALQAVDAKTGRFIAEFNTGRGVTSKPTVDVDNGRLFVMTADANLFSFNLRWKKHMGSWPWEDAYE